HPRRARSATRRSARSDVSNDATAIEKRSGAATAAVLAFRRRDAGAGRSSGTPGTVSVGSAGRAGTAGSRAGGTSRAPAYPYRPPSTRTAIARHAPAMLIHHVVAGVRSAAAEALCSVEKLES